MVVRTGPLVAVVNGTSFNRHFGCEAVMETIASAIQGRGGTISYRHPVGKDWRGNAEAEAQFKRADLILVNGEGTIHHDAPGAKALAALGPFAKAAGKPDLEREADRQGADFISMKHRDGRLLAVGEGLRGSDTPLTDFWAYAQLLGSHSWMLSGRFHAVCMAINMRLPFVAYSSNTWKIEGLIEDCGLLPERLAAPGKEVAEIPYSVDELSSIADYLSLTRQRVDRLFDRVIGRA